jgi:NADH dehydrogenase
MINPKTRVLIVGGGFGGVKTALELLKGKHFEVTLISDETSFRFFPGLHHAANNGTVADSAITLDTIFAGKNITIAHDKAENLDRKRRTVTAASGKIYPYDILVLAMGSIPNHFSVKGMTEYSYCIKTPKEARRLEAHLHKQLTSNKKPVANYVIVGGGPTGVEIAGSLVDHIGKITKYHGIKRDKINIYLAEATSRLLPNMPETISRATSRRLHRLGIRLHTDKAVQGKNTSSLLMGNRLLDNHTIIWAGGIINNPFFANNRFKLDKRGKVVVDSYLETEPDIYVLGDNAATPYSGTAQTALYDAAFVSLNLERQANHLLLYKYKPKRPVYAVSVGKRWAAVSWGKIQLCGRLGWVLRWLSDLYVFNGYEPWQKAGKQWTAEFEIIEKCSACAQHSAKDK